MDLQPPANLPIGPIEPPQSGAIPSIIPPVAPPIQSMPSMNPADDMFSGVERSVPTVSSPVAPPVTAPTPSRVLPPLPESNHPPILHYILIALAVVVVLGVIAGTVWFFAIRRPARQVMETLPQMPVVATSTEGFDAGVVVIPPIDEPLSSDAVLGEPEAIPSLPVVSPPAGTNVPFPNSINPNAPSDTSSTPSVQPSTDTGMMMEPTTPPTADQDSDGLSDARETELGTNFAMEDTDGDGLHDGDEVLKYRTNPLIPDTDGDTFPDGVEVQKSYNPLGSGKCANPACTL